MIAIFRKLAEGAYVAALGYVEWKWRDTIGNQWQPAHNNALIPSRNRPAH